MATATETTKTAWLNNSAKPPFVQGAHGIRYQTRDVARPVAFYTPNR